MQASGKQLFFFTADENRTWCVFVRQLNLYVLYVPMWNNLHDVPSEAKQGTVE
jgi:hypothetical protein